MSLTTPGIEPSLNYAYVVDIEPNHDAEGTWKFIFPACAEGELPV
jgi:hypothetical protein